MGATSSNFRTSNDKLVIISLNEYLELRIDSEKLSRLESGGVNNWEWYSESLYPATDRNWEDKLKAKIIKEQLVIPELNI